MLNEYYKKEYEKSLKYLKENNIKYQTILKIFKTFQENNVKNCFIRFKRILKNRHGFTKYTCLLRYGKIEGLKRYKIYCDKQAYTNSKEYKKMTDEEFEAYNKSRAVTIDNLIKRHGEEKGKEIWNSYCEKQRYSTSKEYFIEKYGEKDGLEKYNNFYRKKAQTLENFIEKYGEKIGKQKFDEFNFKRSKFYSKMSQELFENLNEKLNLDLNHKVYYATHKNSEFCINKNKPKFFDFVISDLKLCIEFNGDNFHANPKIYSENETPNPFIPTLTAKEIWESDKNKLELLKLRNFDYIIVWESDYKNNKENEINRCIEFIKSKISYNNIKEEK